MAEITDEVQDTTPAQDATVFDAEYVSKLRGEAAGYRTKLREMEQQLKQLQPLAQKAKQLEDAQKSESQKLADQLAAITAERDSVKAQAEAAAKQAALIKIAAKAGVAPDVLDLLNVGAFDLSDEQATIDRLKALAPKSAVSGGAVSNPARSQGDGQLSPEEWFKNLNRQNTIFGG
jgi:chromosome segregation ATPase